ncbi:glycosyltransferase family 2 protein [Dyadobacter sp. CY351]|uniref:glycosyltransferase family 2 protein n=1 Tax=Dyadobacter sp. CY351 TaxID=2909337 RepID=UPI001F3C6B9A|nr:glycosyltransferase family 2 protein [Dyadobacter sp. CY351]MCF2518423.1 glycosyltransferase family 2 protein [Dyadobacter sp. CY351]
MTKICVVLAVHNRKVLTQNFLDSISRQSFQDYKIIVVDDGSTDGTSEMIKANFPNVKLISGDGTLWWTASTNLAVKYAIDSLKAEYICTVNDDTEVDFYFLEELYNAAKGIDKAIVGCFAYDIENRSKLLYDGSTVNWLTGKINVLNSEGKNNKDKDVLPVTYYIGRGVLIPSTVFKEAGFYDEKNFPQSWADNDLIFRAKEKGYKVFSAKKAKQFIYADESSHLKLKRAKTLSNFKRYLFKQQGGGNVIAFSKYVTKNYPWYGIPSSLINGILSRILGYWK